MSADLCRLFQEVHRELRPRARMPEYRVRFYAFANINNTIRRRQDRLLVRLSDLLQGAPEAVLKAILHILLAKLYGEEIAPGHAQRYRRYISSQELVAKAHLVRQARGRKRVSGPRGQAYDLDRIFDDLNRRFFHGLLGRPQMTWSRDRARRNLGHYDPAHNTIVVSRAFDRPEVPRCALEYLVYHEMLHLKHPTKLGGSRRCFHSREFQAEEKLFPALAEAKRFLRRM